MFGNNHDDDDNRDTTMVTPEPDTSTVGAPPATDNQDAAATPSDDPQTPPPFVPDPELGVTESSEESVSQPAVPTDSTGDAPVPAPPAADSTSPAADSDLLSLKQQALEQLSPLIEHLDQAPEERFRTLMMMIQATDNKDLVDDAYEAAQKIEDESVKAQALLDVINEINYFTQQNTKS